MKSAKLKAKGNQIICSRRLYNQQVSASVLKKPCDIVEWMGAVQAQDYSGAKWSIGLRLQNSSDQQIEQAIADKTIIRSWPLRGTLHFIAAEDIRWILDLTAPRIIANSASRHRELELDDTTLKKCIKVLIKKLRGGKQLTRDELTNVFSQAGIKADGMRLSHILYYAGLKKLICFGIRREKQFTYTLLDEWLPENSPKIKKFNERDEALAELTKRYFTGRGPAALQDFIWWSGLSAADAKKGIEIIKTDFTQDTIEGKLYLMPVNIETTDSSHSYLLPGFDEYLIGYKDRSAALDRAFVKHLNSGGGMLRPTIIINGKVMGVWRRTLSKASVQIEAKPFTTFDRDQKKSIAQAANKYGKFLGLQEAILFKKF